MLVAAIPLTDEIGFAMSVVFVVWHLVRSVAAPRHEPVPGGRRDQLPPRSPSIAFTLSWIHSIEKSTLGGRLAHRRQQTGDRRSAHSRHGRRHGAARRQPC
jgi:hypothetical protein